MLEQAGLTKAELKKLRNDLSWLRTEMKYHVGSYSWLAKNQQIRVPTPEPDAPPPPPNTALQPTSGAS